MASIENLRITLPDDRERRVISLPDDLRAVLKDPIKGQHIVGHASVFDQWTTLYEGRSFVWREVVRPGAYRNAIAERQDVRSLWNHDANYVLGRTASGTLTLEEDSIGLLTDTEPPDTQFVRDLVLTPIGRRDVTQMSFAFNVRRGVETVVTEKDGVTTIDNGGERITTRRDGDRFIEERELLDLDLFDVSPVTYPAYESTDVALRGQGERREREILADRSGRLRDRMRMRLRLADARLNLKGGDR